MQYIEITKLKANPINPRQIKEENFERLKRDIKRDFKFLEKRPLLVYEDPQTKELIVYCGNMRLKACEALGIKEVPIDIDKDVVKDGKLDKGLMAERLLRDNESYGEYDTDLLANNFDLEELKRLDLPGLNEVLMPIIKEQAEEDDFEVKPIEEIKTDIKVGDLFEIKKDDKVLHRLLCGDATKKEDVLRLIGEEKADMCFTDPPYGVSYADKNKYLNTIARGNRIQTEIKNDHMDLGDTSEFIFKAFVNIKLSLAKRSSYYITAPQGGDLMMMMMMMQKAGIPLRHCLIWVKNNHVLGRTDYNYKHEPILYGWCDIHDFYGEGEHRFSTWEIDKPLKNDLHPTMKPIALISNALLNSSKENNIIIDFFLGSGSTMVACHQLNRRCYGMELDPKYCQVILDRMKKLDDKIEINKCQ